MNRLLVVGFAVLLATGVFAVAAHAGQTFTQSMGTAKYRKSREASIRGPDSRTVTITGDRKCVARSTASMRVRAPVLELAASAPRGRSRSR